MKKLRNKLFTLFALCVFLSFGFLVYEIFFSNDNVIVNTIVVENEKIPENYQLNIAVISDIHYQKFMTKTRLKRFIDKLNHQNPDVVLFLGDATSEALDTSSQQELIALLKSIEAKKGKFYVLGDLDNQDIVTKIFDEANFELLENNHTKLFVQNQYINLIGMPLNYDETVFKEFNDPNFSLVMAHYPKLVNQLPNTIDYMVAGHTLGKQVNIPFISEFKAIPDSNGYTSGIYKVSTNTTLYVNMGLGTLKNDIRFLAPPEITILSINGK